MNNPTTFQPLLLASSNDPYLFHLLYQGLQRKVPIFLFLHSIFVIRHSFLFCVKYISIPFDAKIGSKLTSG